ncbi:MAG: CHASE3 domain-containing protein [Proteobacteria bacterium]|nr:CHASE3 domain-containing protein [Pseudomonadota bacterium]
MTGSLSGFTAFIERLRHSALAIPAAAVMAALMLGISESAYRGADSGLSRLVEMGQARLQLVQMLQRLSAAESGKRGYLLTGGDEYLQPYQSASADVQASLRTLQTAYTRLGDEQAQVHLRRVAELVNAKLSEMEEVLRLAQQGRHEAAVDVVRSGIGREVMDQLLQEGQALTTQQNRRIEEGLRNVFDVLLLNRIGVATLTAVSLMVLVLFVRQGRLLHEQRREQQAAVQAERDRLEQEVLRRTAELTELARHLQTAREDERARLARDLHDELGALLTAAKLDVARIRPKLQQSAPDLLPRLTHLTESLNSGIALKRRIIEDLRPSTLSSLGLVPALEILCREFSERSGITVDAVLEPVRLAPGAELTVFRLVQEALTNVAKYAQASQVELQLDGSDGVVQVSVRDNGVGFQTQGARAGSHGLLGMRYRVEADRGQFQLQSAPGGGTTVSARLPACDDAASTA